MKKIIGLGVAGVLSIFLFAGCAEGVDAGQGTVKDQQAQQQKLTEESNRQVGMPNISNYFEKDIAKRVYELRDKTDLTTYAYSINKEGQYIYLGRCIGFGLPYTTQYSSPQRIENADLGEYYGDMLVPQPEPNGLYTSESTNATWLILINEETNKEEIIYMEPEIIVTQSKLPKRLVAEWSLPDNY